MNGIQFLIHIALLEVHAGVIFCFLLPEVNDPLSTKHGVQDYDSVAEAGNDNDQQHGADYHILRRSFTPELDQLKSKAFKRSVYFDPDNIKSLRKEGDSQPLLLEDLQNNSPNTFGKTETDRLRQFRPVSADLNVEKKRLFESNFRSRTLKFMGEIGDEPREAEPDAQYRSRTLKSIQGVEDEPKLFLNQRMLGSERTSARRRLLGIETTTDVVYVNDPYFQPPIPFEGFSKEEIEYVDIMPDLDCQRDEDGRCTSDDAQEREYYRTLQRKRYTEVKSKIAMFKAKPDVIESTTPEYTYIDDNIRESL